MHASTYDIHPLAHHWLHMSSGPGPRGRRRGGPGPRGFGGFPGHRGPRARRGDIRTALLVLLAEEPRNGYGLMQEVEQRSDGAWRPSPGSVYPALQQLEDEGLVSTGERDGRRVYELTDAGREEVARRPADASAPWDLAREGAGSGPGQLLRLVRDVHMAAAQIVRAGDEAQLTQAQDVLRETRRTLYRILAEDPPDAPDAPDTAGE